MKQPKFTTILIDPLMATENEKFIIETHFLLSVNECGESFEFIFEWINRDNIVKREKCSFENRKTFDNNLRGRKVSVGFRQMAPFIFTSSLNSSLLIGIEYEIVQTLGNRNNFQIEFVDCSKLVDCLGRYFISNQNE